MLVREAAGEQQLLAYVVASQKQTGDLQAAQIAYWRELYDSTYRQEERPGDDFDLVGWKSSYTGEAIPAAEMRVWVEETVDRIRRLQPRRALEIGCGSGPVTDASWRRIATPTWDWTSREKCCSA